MSRLEITQEKIISILIIVISVLLMGGIAYFAWFSDSDGNEEIVPAETMPDIVGYSFDEVKEYYGDMFELSETGREYSDKFSEGAILSQSIAAGSEYEKGSSVKVTVSLGAEKKQTSVIVTEEPAETETSPEETTVSETVQLVSGMDIDVPEADFESFVPDFEIDISCVGFSIEDERLRVLYDELYSLFRPKGADAGFLYYDPASGISMEYNGDERFSAGSIIKAVYARSILDSSVDLDAEYEMTEDMLNSPYELVNGQPVGTMFTVRELIEAALVKSDNTAYKMLYNYVGYDNFNRYAASLGLRQRMTDDNYWFRLTARESAVYFKDIYNFIAQHVNGGIMLDCMTNTEYREMFASALEGKTVAEKYGYLPQEDYYTLGDCAIVYGEEKGDDYILVMYWRNTGKTVNTEPFRQAAAIIDEFHGIMKGITA